MLTTLTFPRTNQIGYGNILFPGGGGATPSIMHSNLVVHALVLVTHKGSCIRPW